MTEGSVGRLTAYFDLDTSGLDRGLKEARTKLKSFNDDTSVRLNIETSGFDRGVVSAKRKLSDLSNEEGSVEIGAVLGPLEKGIARARGILGRFGRERAEATVGAKGVPETNAQLANVRRFVTNLNGRNATLNVGARGVAGTVAGLGAVNASADKVDGRRVSINANPLKVASDAFVGLGNSIQNTASRIRAFGTIIPTLSFPLLLGGLGAIPGAASAASMSLLGLIQRMGQGLQGAAVIGGTALGGMAAGLYAYAGAAKAAVGGAMLVREETRKASNEQLQQQRIAILNTQAARIFNNELDRQVIALTRVQAELGNRVLPAFTRMMALFRGQLPQLTPPLYRLVDGVTAVGESFVNTVLKGQGLRRLQNVLDFVSRSGITAAKALSNLGRFALAAIQPIIPAANRLNDRLLGITRNMRGFAESARGQQAIGKWVANLERRFYELLGVLRDTGRGISGVFDSLNRTGVSDQAWRGLQNLASGFASATKRGTETRRSLDEFNRSVKTNMPAISSLLGTVFRQFGRIAKATLGMRTESGKLTVMQQTFRNLEPAVRAVSTLLINSFRRFGPMIGPVITEVARFLDTLINKNPVAKGFANTILGLLRGFNNLPQPVKSAAVALGSLGTIIAGIGLIGFISSVAGLGRGLRMMAGPAMTARTSLAGMGAAGATSAAGTTAAGAAAGTAGTRVGFLGRMSRIASGAMKAMGVAATFALGPWGLLIAAGVALGAGLYLLYKRSERFRNAVNALGNFIKNTALAAFRGLVNVAKSVWQWFTKLPAPVQMLISPLGALVANFGRIRNAIGGAIRVIGNFGRIISGVFTGNLGSARAALASLPAPLQGIGRALGMATARVRVFVQQAIFWLRVQTMRFMAFWRQAWPEAQRAATAPLRLIAAGARLTWKIISTGARITFAVLRQVIGTGMRVTAQVAQAAWRVIAAGARLAYRVVSTGARVTASVVRVVWGQLVKFWRANSQRFASSARATWRIISTVIGGTIKQIGNVIRLGMQVISGDWRKAGNTLRRIWQVSWDGIKKITSSAWTILKNLVKVGASAIGQLFKVNTNIWKRVWTALWNALKKAATASWNAIKGIWNSALKAIGSRVDSWRSAINSKFSALASWARGHWQSFWTFIKNLWNSAFTAIGNRVDSWRRAVNDKFSALASWARGHWSDFWRFIRNLFDDAFSAIGNRTDSWRRAINDKFSALASWARGHWSDFWGGLRNMWDNAFSAIGDRARSWGNAIKDLFQKVKGFMTDPMEAARDTLKGIWNTILGGIGKVLGAVGLDKAAGAVKGAMWANGGTTDTGGGQAFANGGISGMRTTPGTAFARGGMGTSGKQPRMHLWNEQMGNEAYITEKGDRRKQMGYLETAADWHNAEVVPKGARGPYKGAGADALNAEHQMMAQTGREPVTGEPYNPKPITQNIAAALGSTHHDIYDYIKPRVDTIMGSVGGMSWNTYRNHVTSPGANEHSTVDFWAPGGRGANIGASKGMASANAAIDKTRKGLLGVAAQGKFWNRGTWQPFPEAPHYDHTHVAWSADKDAGIISGGGGGLLSSLWDTIGNALWSRLVEKPFDSATSGFDSGHVMKAGTKGAAQSKVLDPVKEWIIGESGSSGGQTPHGKAATIGEALRKGGWPADQHVAASSTIWHESRGDSRAYNPSGAKGLMQIMPGTASGVGSDYSKLFDPVYNTATGLKVFNQAGSWGPWVGAGRGGDYRDKPVYHRGGVIPGFGPKSIMAEGGERVLPENLNAGFESLARSIRVWDARSGSNPNVDIGGDNSSLEKKLDQLIEKLDDVGLSRDSRDAIEHGGRRQAREFASSTEGRRVQQANHLEDLVTNSMRGSN